MRHWRRYPARWRSFAGGFAALAVFSLGVVTDAPPANAVTASFLLSAPTAPLNVQRLASLPQRPWLAGHRGLDLAARVGEPVTSPSAGVVTFVGFVVDRPVLSIQHDGGLLSSFEPIDSPLSVGDVVARGQMVGTVAEAQHHCVRSECVHWGLRLGGEYVDPLDYLEGFGPVRLLPSAND